MKIPGNTGVDGRKATDWKVGVNADGRRAKSYGGKFRDVRANNHFSFIYIRMLASGILLWQKKIRDGSLGPPILDVLPGTQVRKRSPSRIFFRQSYFFQKRTCECGSWHKEEGNEKREDLNRDILDLLNNVSSIEDLVRSIVFTIKGFLAIDAVAIRLTAGDDFPYFHADGLSEDFVRSERLICRYDAAGTVMCDSAGIPVLECMCGNIIRGRTDPSMPFFTEGGSFWTNSTSRLLATTTEADRQSKTRNRCNGEGYESVALIPLRAGAAIIGLLQLNDFQPDRYTADLIKFFEGLGNSIGNAVSSRLADKA